MIVLALFFLFKAMLKQLSAEAIAEGETMKEFSRDLGLVTIIFLLLGAKFTIFQDPKKWNEAAWWFFSGSVIWTAVGYWQVGFGHYPFIQFLFTSICISIAWKIVNILLSLGIETKPQPNN